MQEYTLGYMYNASVELHMVVHYCGNNCAHGYVLYRALVIFISIHLYVLEINFMWLLVEGHLYSICTCALVLGYN